MPTKICAMCGSEFYTRSHTDYCKECRVVHRRTQNMEYRDANRERTNLRSKQYRDNNKEKLRATRRAYYLKNREKLIADAIRRKRKISPLETTVIVVQGQRLTLYHCDRLHIKARHLPCGDKWECWDKTKCPHIPKCKEPKTFEGCVMASGCSFNEP